MSKATDNLDNNKTDWATVVAKGGLGAIPIAGSFLAEVAGELIPNQRMDRIVEYARELNKKFEELPGDVINRLRTNEQFIDLIEESFIRVSRASTEARRKYILSIIQSGISEVDANLNNAKYLLGLLSEINDAEVIWLRYFHERSMNDKAQFQALHKNVLAPVYVTLGSGKEERYRGAVQDSYKEHLERLGLIEHHITMKRDLGVPEYDTFTNKPRVSYSETTTLGNMLLESIGLINNHPSE